MAGADSVYIGLLHQHHIAEHGLHIDGVAIERVDILCVDTLEEHALAVYIHQVALDGHISETVFGGEHHLLLTVCLLAHDDGIEIGLLGRPGLQAGEVVESEANVLLRVVGGHSHLRLLLAHQLALGVEELYFERLLRALLGGVVEGKVYVEVTRSIVVLEGRCDVMVGHEGLGRSHEIYIAVDASEVPHVLTLKVRTVAPAVDAHRHVIVALAHKVGHIKFGVGVGALRIASILAVYPHHNGAAGSVEVEKDALVLVPTVRQAEVAAIGTYGVLVEIVVERRDERGLVLEGIAHIIIYGHIISGHLPVERDLELFPRRNIGIIGPEIVFLGLALLPVGGVAELPFAVEQQVVGTIRCEPWILVAVVLLHRGCRGIGHKRGVGLLLAVLKLGLVFYPLVHKGAYVGLRLHHLFLLGGTGVSQSRCAEKESQRCRSSPN